MESNGTGRCPHCVLAEGKLQQVIAEVKGEIPAAEPQHLFTALVYEVAKMGLDNLDGDPVWVLEHVAHIVAAEAERRKRFLNSPAFLKRENAA